MSSLWMEDYGRIVQAITNEEDDIVETFSLFGRPTATLDIFKNHKYLKYLKLARLPIPPPGLGNRFVGYPPRDLLSSPLRAGRRRVRRF